VAEVHIRVLREHGYAAHVACLDLECVVGVQVVDELDGKPAEGVRWIYLDVVILIAQCGQYLFEGCVYLGSYFSPVSLLSLVAVIEVYVYAEAVDFVEVDEV